MFRRNKKTLETADPQPDNPEAEVDWSKVPERLRPILDDALNSFDRWRRLVERRPPGALREALNARTERIAAAVREIHAHALRVGELDRVVSDLDADRVTDRYKDARRQEAAGTPPAELDAIRASFASMQAMMNASADAEARLRALDARLEAAVAQGAELMLVNSPMVDSTMDAQLDDLVRELGDLGDALRSL